MPLTINVGLSRKASKDFQSTGTSINLCAELDQSLLTRPNELQAAVDELYQLAEASLDRQANSAATELPRARDSNSHTPRVNGNGRNQSARGMTQSQKKAIHAIASHLGIDAVDEARHELGVDLEQASISEASKLIDHLKSLQGAEANGSRR